MKSDHRGQGRPDRRPLRHQLHPGRDGRGAALHGKVIIQSSMGIPRLGTYDIQFPPRPLSVDRRGATTSVILDCVARPAHPAQERGGGDQQVSVGAVHGRGHARDVAKQRGLAVPLYLEYEFGTRDYGSIAARVKDANADFLWVGALGLEGNQLMEALKKLDHAQDALLPVSRARPDPRLARHEERWRRPSSRTTRPSPPASACPSSRRCTRPQAGQGRHPLYRTRQPGHWHLQRVPHPPRAPWRPPKPGRQGDRGLAQKNTVDTVFRATCRLQCNNNHTARDACWSSRTRQGGKWVVVAAARGRGREDHRFPDAPHRPQTVGPVSPCWARPSFRGSGRGLTACSAWGSRCHGGSCAGEPRAHFALAFIGAYRLPAGHVMHL